MQKVAICFWGLCRTTNHTISSIQEHVFNKLKGANIDYDTYVHTFSLDTPYSNPRNAEVNINLDNELYKLLNPTHVEIEDQHEADKLIDLPSYRTKGDPWVTAGSINFGTFDNHIRALYSLNKVTQAALKGNYERLIFIRPDVKFMNPINPNWLMVKMGEIIMTDFHLVPINDRFAITTPQSAKVFGLRFNQAKAYSLRKPLHSEQYLKYCLDQAKIKILMVKFRFRRIRAPNTEIDFDITV
jgi:hypothetical protein